MRRCRAALAVLTIVLISVLSAGPASAGGPTSVLLVVPGAGQTASLYTSDPDYEALTGLVGAYGAAGATDKVDASGASHETGTGVTLTWMIHDVQVWRVDRVYLDAKGGPWVSTQTTLDGTGNLWDSPVVWHAPDRGKELAALLTKLGVAPGSGAADTGTGAVTGAGTDVAPPVADEQEPAARTDTGSSTGPRVAWGLGGLVLGVALAMAAVRLLPIARPATAAAPTPQPLDEDPDWALTDQVSWPAPRR